MSMSVIEKVDMFLYTLVSCASNREVQERFQHSGETVSKYFNEVLSVTCLLAVEIIKPVDLDFFTTPREITIDPRYMSYLKVTLKMICDYIYLWFKKHKIMHMVVHFQYMFFF
jgi:hypothetical protein